MTETDKYKQYTCTFTFLSKESVAKAVVNSSDFPCITVLSSQIRVDDASVATQQQRDCDHVDAHSCERYQDKPKVRKAIPQDKHKGGPCKGMENTHPMVDECWEGKPH